MIDSTAADYGTLHKNQTGNNSGSLGSGHLAMRISTAPWEDASDLDEGTRGETSPVFLGSRSDFVFSASDLPFPPEISRFSVWGGMA
jgi:hypothetical protein